MFGEHKDHGPLSQDEVSFIIAAARGETDTLHNLLLKGVNPNTRNSVRSFFIASFFFLFILILLFHVFFRTVGLNLSLWKSDMRIHLDCEEEKKKK
jgi:hypothetical protein